MGALPEESGTTQLVEEFWSRFTRQPNGCLEWKDYRVPDGYGHLTFQGKSRGAHQVAWELSYGRIPEGLCVLHECDNPPCGDPAHLFLGTTTDNNVDMRQKGRGTNPPLHCGEEQHDAVLTAEIVYAARCLYQDGQTLHEIATSMGQPAKTLGLAIRGKTWKHVGGPTFSRLRNLTDGRVDLRELLRPEILRLHAYGLSRREIGRRLGIGRNSVATALRRGQ